MACVADELPAGVASEGGDGGRGGHGIRDGGPITCERGEPWRSMDGDARVTLPMSARAGVVSWAVAPWRRQAAGS